MCVYEECGTNAYDGFRTKIIRRMVAINEFDALDWRDVKKSNEIRIFTDRE